MPIPTLRTAHEKTDGQTDLAKLQYEPECCKNHYMKQSTTIQRSIQCLKKLFHWISECLKVHYNLVMAEGLPEPPG